MVYYEYVGGLVSIMAACSTKEKTKHK